MPTKWTDLRSAPSMLVDTFAVLVGCWWLFSMVIVYTAQSFDTMLTLSFIPVVIGVGLVAALVRPDRSQALVQAEEPGDPRWLFVVAAPAVAYFAWFGVGLPFSVASLIALGALGLIAVKAGPLTAPHPVRATALDSSSLVFATVFIVGLLCWIHRPEVDDAYHINAMISALEHPELPVLSFDGMHGDINAPIQQLIHRPQTWEILIASISHFTGADPRAIYWLYLPVLIGPLTVFACWRLMKSLVPDAAWLGVWIMFAVWMAWGDGYRTYGSYTFSRLAQGKPIFICMMVPALLYATARYSALRTPRAFGLLLFTQCAAAMYSSSALVLAPIAAGIGLLSQMRLDRRGLLTAFTGLFASAPLIVVGLLMRAEVSGVGGLRHDGWMRDMMVVVGETVRAPLALSVVAALPILLLATRTGAAAWAARLVLVSIAVVFNGVTAPTLASIAELFSWRLYWIVPVPLFAGLAVAAALQSLVRPMSSALRFSIGAAAIVVCLGFWTAGKRVDQRPLVSFKWWSYRVPELDQKIADQVHAMTEPTDLVATTPRIAERLTGMGDRPRLVSVRDSYLTNLSRYWTPKEYNARHAVLEYLEHPVSSSIETAAMRALDDWCIDVVVVKRKKHKMRMKVAKDLKERGWSSFVLKRPYIGMSRKRTCTPTGPPSLLALER